MNTHSRNPVERKKTDELFLSTETAQYDTAEIAIDWDILQDEKKSMCDVQPPGQRLSTRSQGTGKTLTARRPSDREARPQAKSNDDVRSCNSKEPPTYEESEFLAAARSRCKTRRTGTCGLDEHLACAINSDQSPPAKLCELEGDEVYELDAHFLPTELPASPTYIAYKPGLTSPSMPSLQHSARSSPTNTELSPPNYSISSLQQSASDLPVGDQSPIKKILVGKARSRRWLEHQSNGG